MEACRRIVVIKYGGHAMDIPDLRDAFFENLDKLANNGFDFVIVHGGGPQINELLKKLDIESSFVNGLRVTDEAALDVVEMALCGKVNKMVVRQLRKAGLNAVGISGEDGNLFLAAQKDEALGRVGDIIAVNPELPRCLLSSGFLPVIAPLALDSGGEPLNINADTAAAALAGALGAEYFILVSDIPGVLDGEGRLFTFLNGDQVQDLRASGVIHGGMIPKIEACLGALRAGCCKTFILDGRQKNSLENYLTGSDMQGTAVDL